MPTIAISRGRYNGGARPGEEQPKLLGWRKVSQTALTGAAHSTAASAGTAHTFKIFAHFIVEHGGESGTWENDVFIQVDFVADGW
jgi:hypothetical protein